MSGVYGFMGLARALGMFLVSMSVLACGEPRDASPPQRVAPPVRARSAPVHEPIDLPGSARDPFAFDPASFSRKAKPRPGEWLDRFAERGESFDDFMAHSTLRATPVRDRIVIQPLGVIPAEHRAALETIRTGAQAFFQVPVDVASPRPLAARGLRSRIIRGHPFRQYFTQAALSDLAAHRPTRALAYIGVTFEDLYPDPKWNFVFGEADPDRRVAVYSLRRFQPGFEGEADSPASRHRALRRSIQLISHETGHVFGLMHCTANECVMNGSNSLDESDRQPIHLCPVCLRKLAHALKFDVLRRYRDLRAFYSAEGFDEEAAWLETRLSRLGSVESEKSVHVSAE